MHLGSGQTAQEASVGGQGSIGNVVAALASFFVPEVGQPLQGGLLMAAVQFVLAARRGLVGRDGGRLAWGW